MTDLERALAAGGKEEASDYDRALQAGGTPGGSSRYPQPRSMTASDEELGIGLGMEPNQIPATERVKRGLTMGADPNRGSLLDVAPSEGDIQHGIDFTKTHGRPMDPMEADPLAQGVVLNTVLGPLGMAASNLMAPYVGAVPAGR